MEVLLLNTAPIVAAAAAAKSLQSCLNLCDPMDSSPPGSSVHRILQARILVGVIYLHPLQWKPKIYFTRTLSYVTLPLENKSAPLALGTSVLNHKNVE